MVLSTSDRRGRSYGGYCLLAPDTIIYITSLTIITLRAECRIMPSEDYTTLGVRKDTRNRVRVVCERRNVTTDRLLRDLLDDDENDG